MTRPSKRWPALLVCAALLGLSQGRALQAEPVAESALIEESEAIVTGRLWTVFSLPGLFTTRGLSVLSVERPVFGRPAAGDRFWVVWSYDRRFANACPPSVDPRAGNGRLVLWFLRFGRDGHLAGLPHGWSLESVQALEQRRQLLDYEKDQASLSERMALVEQVVDERLAELRQQE